MLGGQEEDHGEEMIYHGTYGVTSQTEIDNLGTGAVWYTKDAEEKSGDVTGEDEEFYLYCLIDGAEYYLTVSKDSLCITSEEEGRTAFYYNSLGEFRAVLDDDAQDRVIIDAKTGDISLRLAEFKANINDVRIYTLTDVATERTAFTATNIVPAPEPEPDPEPDPTREPKPDPIPEPTPTPGSGGNGTTHHSSGGGGGSGSSGGSGTTVGGPGDGGSSDGDVCSA